MENLDRHMESTRKQIEASVNRLLATTARNLRKALAENDDNEIERIITLLEKGLEPD